MNDSRTPGPRLSLLAIVGAMLAVPGLALLLLGPGSGWIPMWVSLGALIGGSLGLGVGQAIHGIYSKRRVGLVIGWGALAGSLFLGLLVLVGLDPEMGGWTFIALPPAILFSMAGAITGWWRNPNPDRPRFGRW